MAGEGALREELGLDIQPALDALEPLGVALAQLATDFSTALSDALSSLDAATVTPISADQIVDAAGVTTSLDAALAAVEAPPVQIDATADVSAADAAIADIFDAPRPPVDVEGDTSGLEAGIAAAVEAPQPPVDVTVQADISEAVQAIDALSGEQVSIAVDADTSEAVGSIDALTQAADEATGASGGAGGGGGSGVAGLEGAVLGMKAASAGAQGEIKGVAGEIGGLSAGLGTAVAGGVAFTAFLGETIHLAADAQAQQARFNETFGASADVLSHIHIGNLSVEFDQFSKDTGTLVADLQASATRIGLLGQAAGVAAPKVAATASSLLGVAGALSVSNPRFGDAAAVSDTLSRALVTGRTRALIPYGISLSQNQITQEALTETRKTDAASLTGYEKLVAGLTLVLQQQGDTLEGKYKRGIENAQVQLRALKVALEETLVAVGAPLLQPAVESIQAFLPIAQELGVVLGHLGEIAFSVLRGLGPLLPPIAAGLKNVGDGLGAIADVIDLIPGPVLAAGAAVFFLGGTLASALVPGLAEAIPLLGTFGAAVDVALGPVGLLVAAIGLIGVAVNHLGPGAAKAATDTSDLADAFTATATSADELNKAIDGSTQSVDAFLRKQLALKTAGVSGTAILNLFGSSFGAADKALTGSTDAFLKWYSALRLVREPTDAEHKAVLQFSDTLLDARARLESNAKETLEAAKASGTLSDAQAHAAHMATLAADGTDDWIAALLRVQPIIDHNTRVLDANALSASTASGKFSDLITGIAQGSVSVPVATARLAEFGFTAETSATAAQTLSDAVHQAVNNIISGLPSSADAAKQWSDDVSAAFQKVADDSQNSTGNVQADMKALADSQDPTRFVQNLQKQAASIVAFQASLKTLVSEGLGGLAGFVAQQPIDIAAPLAAQLASHPAIAKFAAAGLGWGTAATDALRTFINAHAGELGLALGTDLGNGIIVGQGPVAAAVDQVSAGAATHFHPDFRHPVSAAMAAAATFLQADQSIGQAAGEKGIAAVAALHNGFGPTTTAEAVNTAMKAAHDAIQNHPELATAAAAKGKDAKDKLGSGFDVKGAASASLAQAAALIPGLKDVPNAAGLLGVTAGEAFGQGLANGLDAKTADVAKAADRLAGTVTTHVAAKHQTTSPSKVAIRLGRFFAEGLAVGLEQGSADTIPAAEAAATTISEATVHTLEAQLEAGIARAAAKAQAQATLGQFVSAAVGALPGVSTQISDFTQGIVSGAQAQASALAAYHDAYKTYRADQESVVKLTRQVTFQFAFLVAAEQKLAADLAAHAPKLTIDFDTEAVKRAQTHMQDLSSALTSARGKIDGDQKGISEAAAGVKKANEDLADASDPSLFIKNTRAKTAESARFLHDLQVLVKHGNIELAKELAQAGPDTAGKLADALASNPARAKSANAAIKQAEAFAGTFDDQITKLFGGTTATSDATKAGTATGGAFTDAFNANLAAQGPNLRNIIASTPIVLPPVPVSLDLSAFAQVTAPEVTVPIKFDAAALTAVQFGPLAVALTPDVLTIDEPTVVVHLAPDPLVIDPVTVPVHLDVSGLPSILTATSTVAPVAPVAPTAAVAGTAAGGVQTLALDLTVVLEDGQQVNATIDVPVPRTSTLSQRVRAEVHAS